MKLNKLPRKDNKFLLILLILMILIIINNYIPGFIINYNDLNDISYISNGDLYSINSNGENKEKISLFFPAPSYIFGQSIPILKRYPTSDLLDVTWSSDGESLGFLFQDSWHQDIGIPGIIKKSGLIFVCNNRNIADMDINSQFQIVGDRNILLIPKNGIANIIQLDLLTCQEKDFYSGEKIGAFLMSNMSWLAVQEEVDDEFVLNVYDEKRNIVFTENRNDIFIKLDWSNDGKLLIYGVEDKTPDRDLEDCKMLVYDFISNEILQFSTGFFFKAAFSPDGKEIVFMNGNGINIYNIESGEITFITEGDNPDWRP